MKGFISTLITAVAIMLGGAILMAFGLYLLRSSPEEKPSDSQVKRKVDTITQPFTSVHAEVLGANLEIVSSTDGVCSVSSPATEKVYYTASVEDGVLMIWRTDLRKWYERFTFFSFKMPTVKVSLPEKEYEKLTVESHSMDVLVASGVTFDRAELTASSGDIQYLGEALTELKFSVSSGSIFVQGVSTSKLSGTLTSGRMEMENISCDRLDVKGTSGTIRIKEAKVKESCSFEQTSGSVTLSHVVSQGQFFAKLTSGSLRLDQCDGETLSMKLTSGSVRGSLCSDKWFNVKSTSGSVDVPPSVPHGGLCEIETTSGSVNLTIEKIN